MRLEVFSTDGFEIHNALSTIGHSRAFCTWSESVGVASGRSLVYPWQSLRRRVEIPIGEDRVLRLTRTRAGLQVTSPSLGTPLLLFARGIRNEVFLQRGDGSGIAVFPALNAHFTVDLEASAAEKLVLLAVIGAGLVRRARKGGLLAQAFLPIRIG